MTNQADLIKSKIIADYPVVSIITPVLNGIKYLEACIQSVLKQSYPYVEHVFVDGASSDGTAEMLSNYKSKHPDRISFISEPDSVPGAGAGEAWNKGLKIAKGDIFGWLGADDMLCGSDAIQTVVEFFRSNPNACFVHGGCNYVNEQGEILFKHKTKDVNLDELINCANFISCPSAFYRRAVVEKVGWLDTYGNDYDYMIRIAKIFQMYRMEKVLSNFRVHPESETGSFESYVRVLRKDYLVSKRHGGRFFSRISGRYYMFSMIDRLGLHHCYAYAKQLLKTRMGEK